MTQQQTSKLPVLFITHGSPMLAVDPGKTGPALTQLGEQLAKLPIKAILVVSAHWLSYTNPYLTAGDHELDTLHDFGGFPHSLYKLTYPASGSEKITQLIQTTLKENGFLAQLDVKRGLDHGAWVPLRYLFPHAPCPVVQLSLPWPLDAKKAIEFGSALKALREQGILIITSGSMTHNLYDVSDDESAAPYILPFVDWMRDKLTQRDKSALENYRTLAPYAVQAHPTEEHLFPLMVAFGATDPDDKLQEIFPEITYHALAMDHYIWS